MSRGKENNAGDAKVWSVEDDLVVYDHLKSYMPGPKLAKSPKVAALVAKLSASADEIVARYGELVDISGPARLRLDEAVSAKARAREGLAAPAKKAPPKAKKSGGAALLKVGCMSVRTIFSPVGGWSWRTCGWAARIIPIASHDALISPLLRRSAPSARCSGRYPRSSLAAAACGWCCSSRPTTATDAPRLAA